MSKKSKPSTKNAWSDVDPKDAGTLVEKAIKVLQDLFK